MCFCLTPNAVEGFRSYFCLFSFAGALDLERQDAYGCTLMHYVCALRNSPALQLLLHANVDPMVPDSQGMSATDWARAYRFHDGEQLISRTMVITPTPPTTPSRHPPTRLA